jgi:hypothetical protein
MNDAYKLMIQSSLELAVHTLRNKPEEEHEAKVSSLDQIFAYESEKLKEHRKSLKSATFINSSAHQLELQSCVGKLFELGYQSERAALVTN